MRFLTRLWTVSPIWIILLVLTILILAVPIPNLRSKPVERVYQVEAARFAYSPGVLRASVST